MNQKLTPKALVQIQTTVNDTLGRLDRRLDKLSLRLEDIQAEVNDLRAIRSTLNGLLNLVLDLQSEKETNG